MKLALFCCLALLSAPSVLPAAEAPLRWGESGYLSKWKRYPYEVDSQYPFLSEIPTFDRFPELLKLGTDRKLSDFDFGILHSQLVTISRCDFLEETSDKPPAEQRQEALKRWQSWWDYFGKGQAAALTKADKTYSAEWKEVAPSPYLPCPGYPLLFPESWSFELTFSSGDYAGMVKEIVRMECTPGKAELTRRYQAGTSAPWVKENWEGFTPEQARSFLAALTYSVDQPWFFIGDEIAEKKENSSIGRIAKRPKAWTDYCPSVRWTGVLDGEGRVILNDDPWSWEILDHNICTGHMLDETIGPVFRLILQRFPDPSYDEESSRWKKTSEEAAKEEE